MKTLYLLRMYYRELRRQRKRIGLTIFALAWGTFSIVILLAFGEGLNRQMKIANQGLGTGIVIVSGGQTSIPYKGLGKGRRILLRREDVDLVRNKVLGIKHISPEGDRYANTLTHGRKSFTERVIGVYPSFEEMRTYYPQRGSRFLNSIDLMNKRRVVFLGTEIARRLFENDDPVGKTIMINAIPFLIVGIMQDKIQNSMYNGPDVDKAAIPYSTFQTIYGVEYISRFIYMPEDISRAAAVKDDVYQALAGKHNFDPKDTQALYTWDTIEDEEIFEKIFLGIQIFMGIIGGLTLIVAGVGVTNIMYVSAKKRTKEIGIKMALGAKKRYVLFQFVSEALMIAFIGGALGIALSFLIVNLFKALPLEGDVADLMAHPVISADIMVLTALILGMIGFLAGVFPARKAASQKPVEALRYE
jgi:putative ABC transport system permease protein